MPAEYIRLRGKLTPVFTSTKGPALDICKCVLCERRLLIERSSLDGELEYEDLSLGERPDGYKLTRITSLGSHLAVTFESFYGCRTMSEFYERKDIVGAIAAPIPVKK